MQPPNLTPLQSRLLAYFVASYFCLALWTSPTSRYFAYAVEIPAILDNDAPTPAELPQSDDEIIGIPGGGGYAPDFAYLDRSLIGRQAEDVTKLANNVKQEKEISPGATIHFVLERNRSSIRRTTESPLEALEARGTDNLDEDLYAERRTADGYGDAAHEDTSNEIKKRQSGRQIWVSANTCRQPMPNGTTTPKSNPQLVMYISNSTSNQKPGPDSTDNLATELLLFDNGYASFEVQTDSDVYIGISAPNLDKDWTGSWRFELAASTDGLFHDYNNTEPFLYMIDTDSESALFITYDLGTSNETQDVEKWGQQNPFKMYAFPAGAWTSITGMEHSYCALKEQFNSNTTKNFTIETNITTKFGDGHLPRSQFHVQGLDTARMYYGFVVVEENQETARLPAVGQVRGGGKVFQQFNWTTKADDSCQVIFDLDFCDSVAYAVPSNSKFKFNDTALKELYDTQARSYYQNFTKSLAQVACDTVSEAQYSLARTCKDCERDYKDWLCSVLIPRCEDWTSDDIWLQPRNINVPFSNNTLTFGGNITKEFNETHRDRFSFSKSRNPMIDDVIKPGPYKEMKPCEDLCFDIIRSCPAQLGFACPNSPARELSYGKRSTDDSLTCNFPGAVVKLNVKGAAMGTFQARVGFSALVSLIVAALLYV
ncbi:calcium channel subunit Mid1 [Pyrenochaeta sp. MPI-SDFR-AT-0127]|nr:calcium channel subunit Mid1 [Pyrenochaeta sp. MPI-SDFR-AT-0127]